MQRLHLRPNPLPSPFTHRKQPLPPIFPHRPRVRAGAGAFAEPAGAEALEAGSDAWRTLRDVQREIHSHGHMPAMPAHIRGIHHGQEQGLLGGLFGDSWLRDGGSG